MEARHQQWNNDFLLVVSTDQHGARTLVSGVEKINTSPEEGSTPWTGICQHGTRRLDSLTNSPLA
jgi:hypothetical protein